MIGDKKEPVVKGAPNATYVGSEKCKACHQEIYESWKTTGHRHKLMTPEVAKSIRPDIPLPSGYTWDDILYVIGGWGWKSRYISKDGFIITKTKDGKPLNENQFNWETKTWSAYESGKDKKYDCTKCHNTGSTYYTNHMGLPGMVGDWEEIGISCEACHGPGSEHVAKGGGRDVAIVVDTSANFCGKCHVRGPGDNPPVKGGLVEHHEQYQELQGSKMNRLNCVTCHDPHKPVHAGATNPAEGAGIRVRCDSCHADEAVKFKDSLMGQKGVRCIDCHMPKVTKSAVARGKYVGDVRTHIFEINIGPSAAFSFTVGDKEFASGYLTLEYTCLSCHGDKDTVWAAQYAEGIHSYVKPVAPTPAPTPAPRGIYGASAVLVAAVLIAIVAVYGFARRRK